MDSNLDHTIQDVARSCVASMGDVFWDRVPRRDIPLGFRDPIKVAESAVHSALWRVASDLESDTLCPQLLRAEYLTLVTGLDETSDEAITAALIKNADWTLREATEVLRLAREYGTSILRNALALADALDLEDGSLGL